MAKPSKSIQEQISLPQSRDLQFKNINDAPHFLSNISYYRLKGYWWEMQDDKIIHTDVQIEKMGVWKKGLLQKMFV